jgi:hypothetical protein
MVHKNFCSNIGTYAKREIFVQFFIRIYREISGCKLAEFSKLKILQAPYFSDFRKVFLAKLEKMFVCPADTFDNVKGQFPIGFKIWNTNKKETFESFTADVYDREGNLTGNKTFVSYDGVKFLNDWLRTTWIETKELLGYLVCNSNDFQHQNAITIQTNKSNTTSTYFKPITMDNLVMTCIYFAVRKVIPADWLNDRDQFLYPNDKWEKDLEFQNDCLAYTLFSGSNNIQSKHDVNHWIPFTENEVNARDKFDSHFMSGFLSGKIIQNGYSNLFKQENDKFCIKREFSETAQNVFNAGRELWQYYHAQPKCNVNASLYDIREYFQGRNSKGKMNNKSDNETYNELIGNLRSALKTLAKKIGTKVYEFVFLRE